MNMCRYRNETSISAVTSRASTSATKSIKVNIDNDSNTVTDSQTSEHYVA